MSNIRCFEELDLRFGDEGEKPRKWTVLLGENGTGKSTILRSMALVTCGSDGLADLLGQPEHWIRRGTKGGRIEAELVTKDGETRELALDINSRDSLSKTIANSIKTLEPLNGALEHTKRNYFVAGYGVSRRLTGKASRRAKTSHFEDVRAQSVATLFDGEATLNPLESWAMDLDYRRSKDGMQTVRKVLSDFLPGLTFHEIDREAGRLLFKTPDGIVPLQQLSDGYQNVAAWIGDLLFRVSETFDDYKAPLKARGVLIIDEIDLHLHPKWQRSLLSFLDRKLPNMQLVVTTHSAVTAQQAGRNSLYYLKRIGKSVSLEEFAADPGMLLVNQLLMTEAFGLDSDESLELEKRKERYRKLRDKRGRSARENAELKGLAEELRRAPADGPASVALQEDQVQLMRRVQDALRKTEQ